MKNSYKLVFLSLIFVFCSHTGQAKATDELKNADISKHYSDIESAVKLQREIGLLKKSLEKAKLERELEEIISGKAEELESKASKNNSIETPPWAPYGIIAKKEDKGTYIKRVVGIGDDLKAVLFIPGSGQITISKGDNLPGNLKVSKISKNSVSLEDEDGAANIIGFSN